MPAEERRSAAQPEAARPAVPVGGRRGQGRRQVRLSAAAGRRVLPLPEAEVMAARLPAVAQPLAAPAVLAAAADLRGIALMDVDVGRVPIVGGASIYPFCWSVLLAAHGRGLGGVLTTFLSRAERDAAPLLRLPPHHALVATIVLGVPVQQVTKLRRKPVESFTSIDRFDGEVLTG